jgi:hypothetical protein
MYVRTALKCPPAGVSWASGKIRCRIIFGIPNRPHSSAFPSSTFSAFPSSSVSFTLTVITTSSSSFFFAIAFFSACFLSEFPRNHSRPFTAKSKHCADTHNLRLFVDTVDGRGRGLGLADECAIVLNYLSSTMPALISSIHSLAAVTASAITLYHSRRKSGRQDNTSTT